MSYRPMFIFQNGRERAGNAQRFATHDEAEKSAYSRLGRWTLPEGFEIEESDDPVNYRWDNLLGDVNVLSEARMNGDE
jgi:hypothetical protein